MNASDMSCDLQDSRMNSKTSATLLSLKFQIQTNLNKRTREQFFVITDCFKYKVLAESFLFSKLLS